jgi:ceramide glucosyltransferase
MIATTGVDAAAAAATLLGLGQTVAGWMAARRFAAAVPPTPPRRPAVTVLKPLHGDEPQLEAALTGFFCQRYPDYQLVFGVHDRADAAVAVVQRLQARFPERCVALVADATRHGASGKVSNLINMLPAAAHDILVIADSDLHVGPDYLDQVVAALAVPNTGLVTTIYTGQPGTPCLAGRLGASAMTYTFLPGVLVGRALGRQDCLGTTMALRRETLAAIGGLRVLADQLADDAVLGRSVRAQGLAVRLAACVPAATVPERDLLSLFKHELRWGRTIRSLEPVPYAFSLLQYPLFWAALTVLASAGASWSIAMFALAWGVRGAVAVALDRLLAPRAAIAPSAPIWLLPLRDLLSVLVVLCSHASDRVEWRGQSMRAGTPPRAQALRAAHKG